MPRQKSMKSKILLFKRNTQLRFGKLMHYTATRIDDAILGKRIKKTKIDFLSKFRLIVSRIVNRKLIFLNSRKLNSQARLMIKRERISASIVPRILKWKELGTSIFDKVKNSFHYWSSENRFEDEMHRILNCLFDQLYKRTDKSFIIERNPFFASRYLPFLCDSPDFVIYNCYSRRPLTLIEVKEIESHDEFKRYVNITSDGKYELRPSSEYHGQLRAYLNIYFVPSAFLIIRFGSISYIFKCYFNPYSMDEIKCLTNFYESYFLPFTILKKKPKVSKDGLYYFPETQKRKMEKYLASQKWYLDFKKYNEMPSLCPNMIGFET